MEGFLPILAFLLGSIPFGYILGLVKGIDIRKHGSGNVGATNIARVLGKPYGIAVYILDFLKGYIPTAIAVGFYGLNSDTTFLTALGAILGHMFSPFLGFKGGKGVATASGVLFAISPLLGFITLTIWFIVYKLTGYVSVGSIVAAFSAMFLAGMFGLPIKVLLLIGFVATLILVKHKSNIERLSEGRELKV
jgi:glycerol-3-phosphate acyltransferase PlsY